MADLVVIVPSRGRPENIARLTAAWEQTARADSALVVIVDHDDPRRHDYEDLGVWRKGGSAHLFLWGGRRLRLGGLLNHYGQVLASRYLTKVIGFMGDDHLPRTVGWDLAVLGTFQELGSGIVYGDDLLQGEKLPTAAFMTSDIIRTLGWMVPPGLVHLYIDDAWRELGAAMGRLRYLPDVVIEHMHPAAHKAPWDQRYAEVNSTEVAAADKATFDVWMATRLPAAVEQLRAEGVC